MSKVLFFLMLIFTLAAPENFLYNGQQLLHRVKYIVKDEEKVGYCLILEGCHFAISERGNRSNEYLLILIKHDNMLSLRMIKDGEIFLITPFDTKQKAKEFRLLCSSCFLHFTFTLDKTIEGCFDHFSECEHFTSLNENQI
jgi:hypothetical protein